MNWSAHFRAISGGRTAEFGASAYGVDWLHAQARQLPSGEAADNLVHGKEGSLVEVLQSMALRGAVAALGLLCFGFQGAELVRAAVGSTLGIEAGILSLALYNKHSEGP